MRIHKTKRKRKFTLLDTIPGVAEFVLRRETVRRCGKLFSEKHTQYQAV